MNLSKKFIKKVNPSDEEVSKLHHIGYVIADHGLELEILHESSTWTYRDSEEVAEVRDPRHWVIIEEVEFFKLLDEAINRINYASSENNVELERLLLAFTKAQESSLEISEQVGEDTLPPEPNPGETKVISRPGTKGGSIRNNALMLNQKVESLQNRMKEAESRLSRATGTRSALMKIKMSEIQKISNRLGDVLDTVNVYLGSEEQFHIIRYGEGTPAPKGTPLAIRQRMLFMDIEAMIEIQDDGLTMETIHEFDEWILRDGNLDKILPEQRGIVGLRLKKAPRAHERDADMQNFLLLRNGERLYRYSTRIEFHRLIPKQDETIAALTDWAGRKLRPGTREYSEALSKADQTQLGYMKIALAIQGILDRTRIFAPFDSGHIPNILDFSNPEFNFIRDEEIVIEDKSFPPFGEWLAEVNQNLAVKCRIVSAFGRHYSDGYSDGCDRRALSQRYQEPPPEAEPLIVEMSGSVFCVRYSVRFRKTRVSWLVEPTSKEFINVDSPLITDEALEHYMNDRDAREQYPSLAGVGLKRAKRIREEERSAEEPFRAVLKGHLERMLGEELADESIHHYIQCYKTKYRHYEAITLTGAGDDVIKRILKIAEKRQQILKWHASHADACTSETLRAVVSDFGDAEVLGIYLKAPGLIRVYRSHGEDFPGFATIDEYRFSKDEWVLSDRNDWTSLPFSKRPNLLWKLLLGDPVSFKSVPLKALGLSKPEFEAQKAKALDWVKRAERDDLLALGCKPNRQSLYLFSKEEPARSFQEKEPIKGLDTRESRFIRYERIQFCGSGESLEVSGEPSFGSSMRSVELEKYEILWRDPDGIGKIEDAAKVDDEYRAALSTCYDAGREAGRGWEAQMEELWRARLRAQYLDDGGDPEFFETHLKTIPEPEFDWKHLGQVVWAMAVRAIREGYGSLAEAYPERLTYRDVHEATEDDEIQGYLNRIQNSFRMHGALGGRSVDCWSELTDLDTCISFE